MTKSHRNILIAILGLALLLRIGGAIYTTHQANRSKPNPHSNYPFVFGDSKNMWATAENIVAGKGHIDQNGRRAWRTPLYQIIISGFLAFGLESPIFIRMFHALIGASNCLLLFYLTKKYFSSHAGLWASLMAAIYPMFIYFSGLVLTETLSIHIILWILLFNKRFQDNFIWYNGLLMGAILAIATLLKASFGPLIGLFVLWWIVLYPREKLLRKTVPVGSAILAFLLVISPWIIRNYIQLHTFVPFSTMGGYVLYVSNNENATGGPRDESIVMPPETENMTEVERNDHLQKAAIQWIKQNPKEFLSLAVKKFLRTWSPLPNWKGAQKIYYQLAMLFSYGPVMLLALLGIWKSRSHWRSIWALTIPVIYIALLHSVFLGSIRYRLPALPALMVFAGLGMSILLGKGRWTADE